MEETLKQVQTMVSHIQNMIIHTDNTMMSLERKIGEEFKQLNERLDVMEAYLKSTDQDVAFMAREMSNQQDQAVLVVGPPALSDEMIKRDPEREVIIQMDPEEEDGVQMEEEWSGCYNTKNLGDWGYALCKNDVAQDIVKWWCGMINRQIDFNNHEGRGPLTFNQSVGYVKKSSKRNPNSPPVNANQRVVLASMNSPQGNNLNTTNTGILRLMAHFGNKHGKYDEFTIIFMK
ncbi:hypothetical protein CRE_24276 [Caenorhabditis remanei]|uniref:Uncharacterized protein n=1 Tax=Caenorhabditis remanei TaxID=31234 RepID=E3NJ36_CAERE|nr:hypothetical protein CRE_24276 [Caenorhabditis remanei]